MESKDSGSSASNIPFDDGVAVEKKQMVINVVQSTEFHGDPDDTYKVRSNPKGWVLLINNEKFECEKYPTRTGSDVDERNLETLFTQLGLKVLVRRNLKKDDMRKEINRLGIISPKNWKTHLRQIFGS